MCPSNYYEQQAATYRAIRPTYPRALFKFLRRLVPGAELVWDAGAGSGQAAIGLVEFFREIVATDESPSQIEHAVRHPKITYRIEPSERTSLHTKSVDLITVGNALHWFPLDAFYMEVGRVLKPGGVIAAWCYKIPKFSAEIDSIVRAYDADLIGSLSKMKFVDAKYKTIPFPFEILDAPTFSIALNWSVSQLLAYLGSLSAAQVFLKEKGFPATDLIEDSICTAWGNPKQSRQGSMPLYLLVGRH